MKMRLKPLRGKKYATQDYGDVTFLETVAGDACKIYSSTEKILIIPLENLSLPIIDTKDYEKIPDEKYRGD